MHQADPGTSIGSAAAGAMSTAARRALRWAETAASEQPDLVHLAAFASFAIRIEGQLLRRLRLQLLPDSSTSLEADVWFSPLVETRSIKGITFHAEAAAWLRGQLDHTPPDSRDRAWQIVKRFHAGIAPALRVEEEIAWIATRFGRQGLDRIAHLLDAAVDGIEDGRDGLRGWAAQAVWRLPELARETVAAHLLSAAAASELARPRMLPDAPSELYELDLGAFLGDLKRTPIAVRRSEREVAISLQASELPTGDGPLYEIIVPAVAPILLKVATEGGQTDFVEVPQVGSVVRSVGSGAVTLRALDGVEFEIPPPTVERVTVSTSAAALPFRRAPTPLTIPIELLDRNGQIERAREWLLGYKGTRATCVVHGAMDQGHELLISRLVRFEIPRFLQSRSESSSVIELRIPWQSPSTTVQDLVIATLQQIGRAGDDSDEHGLRDALAHLGAAVCCVLSIDAIAWGKSSESTLFEWSELWRRVGETLDDRVLFSIMSIRYDTSPKARVGLFARLLAPNSAAGLPSMVHRMSQSALFAVLPELQSVSREAAEDWLRRYVQEPLLEVQLRQKTERVFLLSKGAAVPMASLMNELLRHARD